MIGHQLYTCALLWICVAVCCANSDQECATYDHPAYGQVGHCTHTSLCPDNAYISGLCPSRCDGVKCCFKNPTSTADCGANVRSLACQILSHSQISLLDNNVYLNTEANSDGADAKSNIRDTCNGNKSLISCYSCSGGSAPGGSVCLSEKVLEYILSLANEGHSLQVNAITGACHSTTSWHYRGTAVDLQIRGSSDYKAWQDKCDELGGVENLGPGARGHATHTHCAFNNN